ncbi:unnamed protein product [Durusdinium trenchii]|uniref:Uncharacterized protein n=2 Tax=Durusdinium trenchii TaxID=1381693 RepID=A0ABP0QAJ7_9DINO
MDDAKAAADGILDSLRQLVNAMASLVPSSAGRTCATDAVDARSLPALTKALRRLWFETHLEATEDWCEEKQAIWLSQLLLILAGSREAVLSFYAAGLLLCNSLLCFAKVLYPHVGMEPDEAWCQGLAAVQTALERDFQEELQYLPADHLGGSKRDAIVSTNRLPALFRRMFDLEGHKLTPAQKGGLAVALVVPGTGLITAGGIGTALLLRKARQAGSEDDPLERLFTKCLEEAKIAIRRKLNPIEVTYLHGAAKGPSKVKVCVQAQESLVPHVLHSCKMQSVAKLNTTSRGSRVSSINEQPATRKRSSYPEAIGKPWTARGEHCDSGVGAKLPTATNWIRCHHSAGLSAFPHQ